MIAALAYGTRSFPVSAGDHRRDYLSRPVGARECRTRRIARILGHGFRARITDSRKIIVLKQAAAIHWIWLRSSQFRSR